jgi:hypothetical protein
MENGAFSFTYTTKKPDVSKLGVPYKAELNFAGTLRSGTFSYDAPLSTPTQSPDTSATPTPAPSESPYLPPQTNSVTKAVNCTSSNTEYNIAVTTQNCLQVDSKEFTLEYDTNDFDIVDLSVFTGKIDSLSDFEDGGRIADTNVILKPESVAGSLKFSKISGSPQENFWSGVINIVRLKAKRAGSLEVMILQY